MPSGLISGPLAVRGCLGLHHLLRLGGLLESACLLQRVLVFNMLSSSSSISSRCMWTLHFVAVRLPPLEEVSQDSGLRVTERWRASWLRCAHPSRGTWLGALKWLKEMLLVLLNLSVQHCIALKPGAESWGRGGAVPNRAGDHPAQAAQNASRDGASTASHPLIVSNFFLISNPHPPLLWQGGRLRQAV